MFYNNFNFKIKKLSTFELLPNLNKLLGLDGPVRSQISETIIARSLLKFGVTHCVGHHRLEGLPQSVHVGNHLAFKFVKWCPVDVIQVKEGCHIALQELMSFFTGLFQLGLLELEKMLLVLLQIPGVIINDVGPLEHLPTLYDLRRTLLQELKLLCRILFQFVKSLNFIFYLINLFYCDFSRLAVILVPFVIIHVSSNLVFAMLLLSQHILEVFVVHLSLLVYIASVVPTRVRSMLLPVRQTEPTKIVLAFPASHMITPLILFYKYVALWTRLGIGP